MQLTIEQLIECTPHGVDRCEIFYSHLCLAMGEFDIISPRRVAAFLAQVLHESGSFRYVREIADGSAYEGRADLGNTSPGDGVKFKGRGLLQVTGKSNYRECGLALGLDLIASPELLERAENACRSAGWYWSSRKLNQFADTDAFGALTKAINGGYNGLDDRLRHFLRIRKALGL